MATNRGRKKRKATASFTFPIPPFVNKQVDCDEDTLPPAQWPKYRGCLVGTSVWIDNCAEGSSLDSHGSSSDVIHRFGCFGKGTLSRSKPGDVDKERKILDVRRPNVNLVTRRHEAELQAQRELARDRVCLDLCHADPEQVNSLCTEQALEGRVEILDPTLAAAEEEELASFRERERSPEISHSDTLIWVPAAVSEPSQASVEQVFEFAPDDDWGVTTTTTPLSTADHQEDLADTIHDEPMVTESSDELPDVSPIGLSQFADGRSVVSECAEEAEARQPMLGSTAPSNSVKDPDACAADFGLSKAEPEEHVLISQDEKTEAVTISDHYHLPFRERLVLTVEEAFFLHFALGCLDVYVIDDGNGKESTSFSTRELWLTCCRVQTGFLYRYVVYHYFRAKGWVCRPGLKFGVDFLLYRTSPEFYHSEYGVVISRDTGEEQSSSPSTSAPSSLNSPTVCSVPPAWPPSWLDLIRVGRVGEGVMKTIILAVVLRPGHLPTEDADCFDHLHEFSVQELVLDRWVPSRTRQS
ncbi:tRNA-splicing endonuclease subunit Sen2-like [Sycon ciliatum]|uniref:tRNA-splicing endonuclease subunit Sen2-like n=1 Tax=Sycon ciliatum TaxID=27933 RepID=UPI0031F6890F